MQRVIIAGYGPVGRTLGEVLEEHGVPIAIIDANIRTVRTQRSLGREAVHGDAADPEVLKAAGVEDAAALAITVPDSAAALEACRVARALAPDLFISVRTSFLSQGLRAMQTGADSVTVEELATAEALASSVKERLVGGPGPLSRKAAG